MWIIRAVYEFLGFTYANLLRKYFKKGSFVLVFWRISLPLPPEKIGKNQESWQEYVRLQVKNLL
jgi:hypothetical protein